MTTSLLSILQQQHQQLVQLNELLLLEREALTGQSPQEVEKLAQQKLTALEQLQTTDQQIKQDFSADDFAAEDVRAIKKQIEQTLQELKKHNEVNGKILKHKQLSTELLSDILIGSRKDKSATTYNQLGRKSNSLKGKPIKA